MKLINKLKSFFKRNMSSVQPEKVPESKIGNICDTPTPTVIVDREQLCFLLNVLKSWGCQQKSIEYYYNKSYLVINYGTILGNITNFDESAMKSLSCPRFLTKNIYIFLQETALIFGKEYKISNIINNKIYL